MDVGCYCVSGSRFVAGEEPDFVYGQQWTGPSGTDWAFTASLRFPDDVLGLFDCGTALPNRDELEAIGSEGSLFLDDPWHAREPVIEMRRGDGVERIEIEPEDSYGLELENLSDAIRGEGKPLLGRDDAVAQARVIEALFSSARPRASRSSSRAPRKSRIAAARAWRPRRSVTASWRSSGASTRSWSRQRTVSRRDAASGP